MTMALFYFFAFVAIAGAILLFAVGWIGQSIGDLTIQDIATLPDVVREQNVRRVPVVQDGRPNLQMEQIKKLADGRIYTGDQAKAAGLVDEIGYLEEAIDAAKKKAGLTEAKVVTYRRPGDYSNNIYTRLMAPSPLAALGNLDVMAFVRGGAPQFMYLWMP